VLAAWRHKVSLAKGAAPSTPVMRDLTTPTQLRSSRPPYRSASIVRFEGGAGISSHAETRACEPYLTSLRATQLRASFTYRLTAYVVHQPGYSGRKRKSVLVFAVITWLPCPYTCQRRAAEIGDD
jgi:hypothetical protein